MPDTTRKNRLQELASRGAEARMRELLDEASSLVRLFPALRESFDPDELPVRFLLRRGAQRAAAVSSANEAMMAVAPGRERRTRTWTAAQKRAAATRMKAYWAKRKRRTK